MAPQRKWIWQWPAWPGFTWDAAALGVPLGRARRAQGELSGVARLFDQRLDLAAHQEILMLEGAMTSAIEGLTLDRRRTEKLHRAAPGFAHGRVANAFA